MTGQGVVQIGAILAGRYRIDRVLGQGGMGIVVQAMHLQLQQPVAIKLLLPEVLGNEQIVQRFLREAQAAVRLTSEHVARVIDVGSLEAGAPYMVLEYLEGADLSSFPRAQLTVGGVIDLMLQACEALAEAHASGIVHRDVKPANLFVTRRADGTLLLKVLDFGISKIRAPHGQRTATQTVMGTPAYMSPEQMRSSHDIDHRSDIWSLGVVLYELLQGVPPFGGDSFSSMVLKVVNDPLPRLTVRLPGDLAEVVYRCLEKDPAKRFQTTAELARAIAKYAQSETQAAISVQRTMALAGMVPFRPALDPDLAHRVPPSTISGAAGAMAPLPRSRSRRRWPIVAAIGVLAGVVVLALAMSGSRKTEGRLPAARPEGAAEPARDTTTPVARPSVVAPPAAVPPPVATPAAPPAPTAPSPAAIAPSAPPPAAKRPDEPAAAPPAAPPAIASPKPPAAPSPARKPRKLTTSSTPPAKPGGPPARPAAPADDDILGKRK